MSTKATLKSACNAFITAVVNIIKHRGANDAIIDEFYGTTINETSAAPSILTPISNANFPYDLFITKKGGQLTIQGWVGNKTGNYAPSGQVFATFDAGEFLPDQDYTYRAEAINAVTQERIRLLVFYNSGTGNIELRLSGSAMSGSVSGMNKQYDIYNAIIVKTAA